MLSQYDDLLKQILLDGEHKQDRTGTGCSSLFGPQLWFDLRDGFPAVTAKKLHWQSVVKELLWFIRGETNIKTLGCKIWDQWADGNGSCGPIYGKQWRDWEWFDDKTEQYGGVDQLHALVHGLLKNPGSRRHLVSAWNVSELNCMGLIPCHAMFQCHVVFSRCLSFTGEGPEQVPTHLDLKMYQRSADVFLGVPFNIASYALLQHCLCQITGLKPRNFIHTFGDVHIYDNHRDAVNKYLDRADQSSYNLPTLRLPAFTTLKELEACSPSDFVLENYEHGPTIPAPIAV